VTKRYSLWNTTSFMRIVQAIEGCADVRWNRFVKITNSRQPTRSGFCVG
jgi:hypothetical protein